MTAIEPAGDSTPPAQKKICVGRSMGERSMGPSMQQLSMEDTKHWPLGEREVGQLRKLKQMYKLQKVNFKNDVFDYEAYNHWTLTGKYHRALHPVSTKDFEMASVDLSAAGFLLPFVDSCLILLRDFKLRHLKDYRHHPAALVVNEFHHFAMYLSTVTAPDPTTLKKINHRIQLIQSFITETDTLHGMKFYSEWMTLMKDTRKVLEGVHAKWPLFLAQQTIQVTLDRMAIELAMVAKKLLIYQMYVLNGGKKDFKFDPSLPLQVDISESSLAEGLIYMSLMNEHVHEALNVPVDESLHNAGAIVFTQLGLPVPDPDAIKHEPDLEIKQYIDQASTSSWYQTGLASKSVLHEGSNSSEEFDKAISAWLNLLPKIVGVAGCVRLLRHSHRISGLGGEFLMAKQMSKQFAADIFSFVENCLRSVQHDIKDLHNTLTDVVGQGKASRAQRIFGSSALREGEFEQWSRNFSFAQSSYKDVTHWVHDLLPKLADLKERVNNLEVEAVEKKIRNEGTTLLNTAGNLFSQFGQWHDSKIPVSNSCIRSIADDGSSTCEQSSRKSQSLITSTRHSIIEDEKNQQEVPESTVEGGEEVRWALRKQFVPVPQTSELTQSMEFRKAMAEEMNVGQNSNILDTSKEAKTWSMQYRESLLAAQASQFRVEENETHLDTNVQAPEVSKENETHLDTNVQKLEVLISDRRSRQPSESLASRTSERSEKRRAAKCPYCTHTLDSIQPSGIVALLHSRSQCDECGCTITRRMPRHICRHCAKSSRFLSCLEGSRSQASGYTMCTGCAMIPGAK
jgi:hypothetical protein